MMMSFILAKRLAARKLPQNCLRRLAGEAGRSIQGIIVLTTGTALTSHYQTLSSIAQLAKSILVARMGNVS